MNAPATLNNAQMQAVQHLHGALELAQPGAAVAVGVLSAGFAPQRFFGEQIPVVAVLVGLTHFVNDDGQRAADLRL